MMLRFVIVSRGTAMEEPGVDLPYAGCCVERMELVKNSNRTKTRT